MVFKQAVAIEACYTMLGQLLANGHNTICSRDFHIRRIPQNDMIITFIKNIVISVVTSSGTNIAITAFA